MTRDNYKESKALEFITNRFSDLLILTTLGLTTFAGTGIYNTHKSLEKMGPQLEGTARTLDNAVDLMGPPKRPNYDIVAYHKK
jgi:hypothetical protein|tara:strand:+ start:866 stop:1114 length:249 start_codon:yes stop_codon:yes gene_type:complete